MTPTTNAKGKTMKTETIQAAKENLVAKENGQTTISDEGIRLVCELEGIQTVIGFKTLWINEMSAALAGSYQGLLTTPKRDRIEANLAH
jgi:hypothetical protein